MKGWLPYYCFLKDWMNEQAAKRFAVFVVAAGLSTWAIDMAATQVGLPSMQAALGISVTASQWILNLTLMILAGMRNRSEAAPGRPAGPPARLPLDLYIIFPNLEDYRDDLSYKEIALVQVAITINCHAVLSVCLPGFL